MQAVILAGGKGTRLNPYTAILPKPLVPVGEYPILEIIIRQLKHCGIEDLVISTGHLAQLIESYFGNGKRFGVKIRYVKEDKPLGTAGAIGIIKGLKRDFIVMNGDILTTLNYKKMFNFHLNKKGIAAIGVTKRLIKDEYGIIEANRRSELENYIEKPTHSFCISMGINALNIRCRDYINKDESIGMPELFLRIKRDGEKVYCYESGDFWLDIGRPDDFRTAQDEFAKNSRRFIHSRP
jgi:NDP-sugar pyrophosphorylase family protein